MDILAKRCSERLLFFAGRLAVPVVGGDFPPRLNLPERQRTKSPTQHKSLQHHRRTHRPSRCDISFVAFKNLIVQFLKIAFKKRRNISDNNIPSLQPRTSTPNVIVVKWEGVPGNQRTSTLRTPSPSWHRWKPEWAAIHPRQQVQGNQN